MSVLVDLYQQLNTSVTWSSLLFYGFLLYATYLVYSFGIKPFLSPLRKLPGPPYNPFFGNVREAMVGQAMESSVRWVKKYGGVLRFYHLLGRERVLVADPQALRHVMVVNEANYERVIGNDRVLGEGIFNVKGKVHQQQRRLLNPFFTNESIKGYLEVFKDKCADLMDFWNEKIEAAGPGGHAVIDVQEDFLNMTFDIIGQSIFGHEFKSLRDPSNESAKAIHTMTGVQPIRLINLLPFSSWLPTADNKQFEAALEYVNNLIASIIEKKRQMLSTEEGRAKATKDFLGRLMLVKDQSGEGLSQKTLRDQVLSILIAGHETTAMTMSWFLLTLAQHPEEQAKLRKHVTEHLPPNNADITWDDLEKMDYLVASIKECQRLYPVAPTFVRRAVEDDHINGYFIPKDTTVIYHVGAMMRNPEIWPEPESFKPERFLDEQHDLYTYIPFATGPHLCLGHRFAKMQMRLVMSCLLRAFTFDLVPGLNFVRKLRTVLKSSPNVQIKVGHATS